uniref:Immunity protein 35 domain-containing protein n=1 Tax=Streptomyces sp. NBC_01393 TaxID=2903851 RepID=A0AAU3HXS2_9ACTN
MTARDIAGDLPDIDSLKNLCRSMAMAEAILNPDGECFYSYSAEWSETEQVASMRNGSGDEYDIVFAPVGAYIRGFDHESPLSPYRHEDGPQPWPGVLDSVPETFRCYVNEPAFTDEAGCPVVTACLWRETGAPSWQTGQIAFPDDHPDPDGSARLFELLLAPTPEAFQAFAEDYYEMPVDIEALRQVYELRPLGLPQIIALNSGASVSEVVAAARAMGYPLTDDLRSDAS